MVNRDKKSLNTVTRKTHKHLFSFMKEEQQGEEAMKQLRRKYASTHHKNKSKYKFKINFNRFKTIFANSVPETYFDVMYAIGGI